MIQTKSNIDTNRVDSTLVATADANPFGGVTEQDAMDIVAAYTDFDPELAATEFSIALESVARAISFRMDNANSHNDNRRLAFFLVSDRPRGVAERLGAQPEPILDNGSLCLCGSIWVTGANCNSGYGADLHGESHRELFQEVIAKGAGNDVAIVFDPSATDLELRFYPRGIANPDMVQRFFFREMTFSLDKLDNVLNRLYEESLKTPDAAKGLGIWNNAEKYHPVEKTEERLQGLLRLTLSIAFDRKLFSVSWEVPGTEGRCDLLMKSRQQNMAGHFIHHAVLELKVLRSFSSKGKAVAKTVSAAAIKKGLGQARSYKKTNDALYSVLCCFDMRTPSQSDGDKCFDPVRNLATKHKIQLRGYRLYGSPEDLRADAG